MATRRLRASSRTARGGRRVAWQGSRRITTLNWRRHLLRTLELRDIEWPPAIRRRHRLWSAVNLKRIVGTLERVTTMTHDSEQDRRERAREGRTLVQADEDIVQGERRVAAQMLLLEQLRSDGHDTRLAEKLPASLQATLSAWRTHRALIVQRIAQLDGRLL